MLHNSNRKSLTLTPQMTVIVLAILLVLAGLTAFSLITAFAADGIRADEEGSQIFVGAEYTTTEKTFPIAWNAVANAVEYEVEALWIDPANNFVYRIGKTAGTMMVIPKKRNGHFAIRVRALTIINEAIIIDNSNEGTSSVGSWAASEGANSYGEESLCSEASGALYTFEKALNGEYYIFLWWTVQETRSASAPVKVFDGDKVVDNIEINQRINGGKWNSIGSYNFSGVAKIIIASVGNGGSVCADAIKFGEIAKSDWGVSTDKQCAIVRGESMAWKVYWRPPPPTGVGFD